MNGITRAVDRKTACSLAFKYANEVCSRLKAEIDSGEPCKLTSLNEDFISLSTWLVCLNHSSNQIWDQFFLEYIQYLVKEMRDLKRQKPIENVVDQLMEQMELVD